MFYAVLALFALLSSIITLLILYARWNYGILEKLNIPVVKPHFFLGSLPDLHKKVQQDEEIMRYKKLGPVFGLYEGRRPQIFVCDPELIKLIFVKDYEYFRDRGDIELGHPISNAVLDYLPYETWKYVRSNWTRTFSTTRIIKSFSLGMEELTEEFTQDLLRECGGKSMEFDIRGRFLVILSDILTNTFCGVKMSDRKELNNTVITLMKEILCENVRYTPLYNLSLVFPFLKKVFLPFRNSGLDRFQYLILTILESRRANNNKNNDVADVLLDMKQNLSSEEYQKLGITQEMIMGYALELFFAIYDSTGTAMTFLIHYLTQHPRIQDRLLTEIDSVVEKHDGRIGHETISEMPYLKACLDETVRLTPPFLRPERACLKDWEYNGLKIPKGMTVMIPIFAANRNPEVFETPDTFDPERFLPENKKNMNPYAYTTFGFGPKMCPGTKLAFEVAGLILARLLKDFRFELRQENDGEKIEFKPGTLFFIQYKPIVVNIIPRH